MNEDFNLTTTEEIQNLIYTIREKKVMLDSDVARLYHTETKKINQAVKRNIERFPEDFCFSLNLNEFRNLKSQIVTSSLDGKNEASIKDLGKKCFAINKIENQEIIKVMKNVI